MAWTSHKLESYEYFQQLQLLHYVTDDVQQSSMEVIRLFFPPFLMSLLERAKGWTEASSLSLWPSRSDVQGKLSRMAPARGKNTKKRKKKNKKIGT